MELIEYHVNVVDRWGIENFPFCMLYGWYENNSRDIVGIWPIVVHVYGRYCCRKELVAQWVK